MHRYCCLLLCLALPFTASPALATPVVHNESRLAVYTHGLKVGEIVSNYARHDEGGHDLVIFSSHTRVNADLLVVSYALEGDEEARIGTEGTRSYHKQWRENGVNHRVDGRLDGGEFRCVRTEADHDPRIMTFPRAGYDFTTMDCPELRIGGEGETLTVRLLDLELCEVVTRKYRWVRSERLTVNGVTDSYRVIEFRDRNKSGTRWILPDTVGVRIARQDGRTGSGSYSVRAVPSKR